MIVLALPLIVGFFVIPALIACCLAVRQSSAPRSADRWSRFEEQFRAYVATHEAERRRRPPR